MRDYINIGSSPAEETCVQVGTEDYARLSRIECNAYIEAIRKKLGDEPVGARLAIKAFPHDFGTYNEVICYYDDEIQESVEYAFKCEAEAPGTWEEVGMTDPLAGKRAA